MRNPLKDILYFSRGEKRGILVLIVIIVTVFLSEYIYIFRQEQSEPSAEEIRQQAAAMEEYKNFIASVREKEKKWKQRTYPRYREKLPPSVTLTTFNPNTADSATFRRLGLPAWMAGNILRYRRKGGKFRRAEDFRKIYGLTEEQFSTLAPYIDIAPEETPSKDTPSEDTARKAASLYLPAIKRDSIYKYPAGTLVELNTADTTELKKIPGIGSGIARLIVNYRQRLGGFYRIEQLAEIRLDYRQLQSWFLIHPADIRPVNLNRMGVERLRQHPYINFYQAKAIVEYRRKHGDLSSLKPLALYEEFTEADIERISRYACFE